MGNAVIKQSTKRISFIGITCFLFLITIYITSCDENIGKEAIQAKESFLQDTIERGKYLVRIGGCGDCHSSKAFGPEGRKENEEVLLGGYQPGDSFPVPNKKMVQHSVVFNQQNTAFAGPWGISYAANITSDDSGIGAWTYEQFELAMREGKYMGLEGSRTLLPPMPWPNYRNMADTDMKAIFAYLKHTKPVNNIVPAPKTPAVFEK